MTAANRREYPVSSAVLEDLLTEAQTHVDQISARIGNGERVTADEVAKTYTDAFVWLHGRIYSAISDVVAAEIRKTIEAQQDLDDAAAEFPL